MSDHLTDEELELLGVTQEQPIPITNDQLRQISNIGDRMIKLGKLIGKLQLLLEEKEREFDAIQYGELPEAMDKVELSEFRLLDGRKIAIKPVVKVSYQKENIDEIDVWMDENGHSGLVKRAVVVEIPRGPKSSEYVRFITKFIEDSGLIPEDRKSIHWQTLNKWGREMVENGDVIPEELFNVFQGRQAKISD